MATLSNDAGSEEENADEAMQDKNRAPLTTATSSLLLGRHGDHHDNRAKPIQCDTPPAPFPLMPRCHVHMSPPVCILCLQGGAADLVSPACSSPSVETRPAGWRQMAKQTGRRSVVATGLAYASNCIWRKQRRAKLNVASK